MGVSVAIERGVVGGGGGFYPLGFPGTATVLALLERPGGVPLPPYIAHAPRGEDERRYQTVYARSPGAVAAPTAGLHFDELLLAALAERGVEFAYVTLHVGAGTFQPVRVKDLAKHRMHGERYAIPQATAAAIAETRKRGGSIVAVGTTTVRCLEASAAAHGAPAAGWPRPICSSPPGSSSGWSTASSPISICPNRRCSCSSPRSPGPSGCGR